MHFFLESKSGVFWTTNLILIPNILHKVIYLVRHIVVHSLWNVLRRSISFSIMFNNIQAISKSDSLNSLLCVRKNFFESLIAVNFIPILYVILNNNKSKTFFAWMHILYAFVSPFILLGCLMLWMLRLIEFLQRLYQRNSLSASLSNEHRRFT